MAKTAQGHPKGPGIVPPATRWRIPLIDGEHPHHLRTFLIAFSEKRNCRRGGVKGQITDKGDQGEE